MKHFLKLEDFDFTELLKIIKNSFDFETKKNNEILKGKTLVNLFFNPSTRTRTSFEVGMYKMGGNCISLEPGNSSWGIEINENTIMNQDKEEHLMDAINVLSSYADAIGIRCFPKFQNWEEDKKDLILNNALKWTKVPLINLETITHPCQALAMLKTIEEKKQQKKIKKFVLTWAYHPKGLNTAVPNSALTAATMAGFDVTLVHPEGYDLDPYYINKAKHYCSQNNTKFEITNNQKEGLENADFVYVKSWGSLKYYGPNFNKEFHDKNSNWILNKEKLNLTNNAFFSHCLPMRHNVKITSDILNTSNSVIYREAENRLYVQQAILSHLLK